MATLLSIVLAALTLFCISLQRTYSSTPIKEVRRRARQGDPVADRLYRVASYGVSLRALLWLLTLTVFVCLFMVLGRLTETWFSILLVGFVMWFGFLWLPAQQATRAGVWLAATTAYPLAWVLQYLHPVIDRAHRFIRRHRPLNQHTGLYERADLLDLIDKQELQDDNRMDSQLLQIVRHALMFPDKTVADVMTPKRVVKAVSIDDDLGPVLMAELHDSGFSRFPVYDSKPDNIVGTLFLRDLLHVRKGGKVSSKQKGPALYLHEEQTLNEALSAILKTHHHLFVVVNSFEDYSGIVTIEDILEELVGEQIIDEFDQYEDLRAVAKITARKQHEEHAEDEEKKAEEVAGQDMTSEPDSTDADPHEA